MNGNDHFEDRDKSYQRYSDDLHGSESGFAGLRWWNRAGGKGMMGRVDIVHVMLRGVRASLKPYP